MRVKICLLFWHVYVNTSYFKIINSFTRINYCSFNQQPWWPWLAAMLDLILYYFYTLSRRPELTASELFLWEPSHRKRTRGRPHTTFLETLKRDTGLSSASEIRTLMEDGDEWRAAIRDSRVGVGWRPRIASHADSIVEYAHCDQTVNIMLCQNVNTLKWCSFQIKLHND